MTPISCADQEGHDGVAKDYAEAMRWYKRAADLGGADGMHDVGWPMNTDRAEIIGGSTVNGSPGLHRTCDQPLCAPATPWVPHTVHGWPPSGPMAGQRGPSIFGGPMCPMGPEGARPTGSGGTHCGQRERGWDP
jgi:hypothetical protein